MSAHARFAALAAAWEAGGRAPEALVSHDWELTVLYLWVHSDGAMREGLSASLRDFAATSWRSKADRSPGWYDAFLRGRETCGRCEGVYRVENLSICTRCKECGCYRCAESALAPNGNRLHACGGEFVG